MLGERVSLGHRATVHGALVGDGALIGIGAIVLGRARIGAGSLVAAGTVVRPGQQVPAGVLVAGVPGRIVRELTDADRATFAGTAARTTGPAPRCTAAPAGVICPPIPDNSGGAHFTSHSGHDEARGSFTAPRDSSPTASWNCYWGSG